MSQEQKEKNEKESQEKEKSNNLQKGEEDKKETSKEEESGQDEEIKARKEGQKEKNGKETREEENDLKKEEDLTEERAKYNISESIPSDHIQERNDDRETDPVPHYDPKTVAPTEPAKTENMRETAQSEELDPLGDMHCPITTEQKNFKEGITLPKLFDPSGKCEDNCFLFLECIINYAMKLAFINGIFFLLSVILFSLLCNCINNIMKSFEDKEEENLKKARRKKSI